MTGNVFSIDGRTFSFEVPIVEALPVGTYVGIHAEGGRALLGQVLESDPAPDRQRVIGRGSLLAALDPSDGHDIGPAGFGAADLERAPAEVVIGHLDRAMGTSAAIEIGTVQHMPTVTARLQATGFGRHTFMCGQSGSGKTYTLGLILERLLLETDLTIMVADPNSDYVKLQTIRPRAETGLSEDEYRALVDRYEPIAERIHVFGGDGAPKRLRVRFGRLSARQQTMVLGIDPVDDPEIYNAFVRIIDGLGHADYGIDDIMAATRASFADDERRLGLRIQNLGVDRLSIWAGDDVPMGEVFPADGRMGVLDLGSVTSQQEASIAAAALLGRFWDQRHERRPTLIVIDEAHNVCPDTPTSADQALATEHVVRIAGEGRKFGLYLLLATQRPGKVHQNVVSQCDNLLMMKMNSATDLDSLSQTFSYAPPALVQQASSFGLGEGLVAGKVAPDPLLFGSGRRFTAEGGSDVPAGWAQRS